MDGRGTAILFVGLGLMKGQQTPTHHQSIRCEGGHRRSGQMIEGVTAHFEEGDETPMDGVCDGGFHSFIILF